jgi:hypothetical protein
MPHVAPWYRREDYARVREIMDDGNRLPLTFDEWERVAEDQLATAAANGIEIKPVILEPEKFLLQGTEFSWAGQQRTKHVCCCHGICEGPELRKGHRSFPPPTLGERRHRGRLVAVRRRAVLMLPEGERPHPRHAHWQEICRHVRDLAQSGDGPERACRPPLPRW